MSERRPKSTEEVSPRRKYITRRLGAGACTVVVLGNIIANLQAAKDDLHAYTSDNPLDHTTSQFASHLFDTTIKVSCEESLPPPKNGGETLGYVNTYEAMLPPSSHIFAKTQSNVMHVRSDICEGAAETNFDATKGPQNIRLDTITILSHEYEHIKGVEDEAAATCYAGQHMPGYLIHMGLPTQTAVGIAQQANQYATGALADNYFSLECRDNGLLDIDAFPTFVSPR